MLKGLERLLERVLMRSLFGEHLLGFGEVCVNAGIVLVLRVLCRVDGLLAVRLSVDAVRRDQLIERLLQQRLLYLWRDVEQQVVEVVRPVSFGQLVEHAVARCCQLRVFHLGSK